MGQVQRAVRLLHGERIGLFIQAMRGNRGGCRPAFRVHAFQHETIVVEFRQDRIAAARDAAQRAALDDLGHVHGEADRKSQQRRQRRKNRRIAGSAGHDHVHIGFKRFSKRSHAHLADDVGGFGDVVLGQRRHAVETGDLPGTNGIQQHRPRNVGAHHRHAEVQSVGAGDVAQHRQRRVQMRPGAGRSGGSDHQRHVQTARRVQHAAQVAACRFRARSPSRLCRDRSDRCRSIPCRSRSGRAGARCRP